MARRNKNAGRASRSAWTTISEILGSRTDAEVVEDVRLFSDAIASELRMEYDVRNPDVLAVVEMNTVQVWDAIRTGAVADESLFNLAWNSLAPVLDLCGMPECRAIRLVEGLIEYQALAVARDIEAGRA